MNVHPGRLVGVGGGLVTTTFAEVSRMDKLLKIQTLDPWTGYITVPWIQA
jgi:hypothetical protein